MKWLAGKRPAGLSETDLPRLELLAELRAALASRPEPEEGPEEWPEELPEELPEDLPEDLPQELPEAKRPQQKKRKKPARAGFSRKYWQEQISRPSLLGLFGAATAGLGGLAGCLLLIWQIEASLSALAGGRHSLAGLRAEESQMTRQLDRQLQDNLEARTAQTGQLSTLPDQAVITARMASLIDEARRAGFPVLGWRSETLASDSQMLHTRRLTLEFQASFANWLALRADWLDKFPYLEIRAEKLTASGHTDGLLDIEAEIILHARSPG